MNPTPEIIAPAGDLQKLKFALAYGANAVYCGLPATSLRARENEFNLEDLIEARRLTREAGAKMYLTCNIFPRGPQLAFIEKFAEEQLPQIQPDAVIFADPGIFSLIKKHNLDMKFHLSVQANNVNPSSVQFWYEQGVRRVIVAREVSKYEIKAIHDAVPDMELEAFVHGSICFTYSGRCLISNYMANRDGNRGTCANSCRWKWMEVREEKRAEETLLLEEDEHGSYLFNSKDLCLIEHLGEMMDAGVTSFKIEGRHKTVGYLGTVVGAYHRALDDHLAGKEFDPALLREVHAVANRGYTLGFFEGTQKDLQNYERTNQENPQTFLGYVDADGGFVVRNKFSVGDSVTVVAPGEVFDTTVESLHDEKNGNLTEVHGGRADSVRLSVGRQLSPYSLLRRAKTEGDIEAFESQTGKVCSGGSCG